MEKASSRIDLGTLAPLLLVIFYYGLVASYPGVDAGQLMRLSLTYAQLGLNFLLIISAFAIVGALVLRVARRDFTERPFPFVRRLIVERWRLDRGLSIVVPPLIFALLLPSFNAFKQMILPLAGFGLDDLFMSWDQALFLGHHPWQAAHGLVSSADASWVISRLYHQWYFPMAIGVFLCAVLPVKPALRTQYLLSYALVWILVGSLFAFLLPSAGPAFWHQFHGGPDPFAGLIQALAAHDRIIIAAGDADGLSAIHFQAALASSFAEGRLLMGRGISAMPSVHIALAVHFACAAFAVRRWLGYILAAYALVIWFGSFYLGWHYALDGIVAAAIIIPVWALCGRWARFLHRPKSGATAVAMLPQPAEAA